jgi:hypothetical protein
MKLGKTELTGKDAITLANYRLDEETPYVQISYDIHKINPLFFRALEGLRAVSASHGLKGLHLVRERSRSSGQYGPRVYGVDHDLIFLGGALLDISYYKINSDLFKPEEAWCCVNFFAETQEAIVSSKESLEKILRDDKNDTTCNA